MDGSEAIDPGMSAYPSLDIALDLTREQLAAQQTQAGALDSKAGFVLGSASLLTGVLVAFRPATGLASYPEPLPTVAHYLPFAAIVTYLVVISTSYRAYSLRRYQVVANPRKLYFHYLRKPAWRTKGTVLRTMLIVYARNERTLRAKVRWARAALAALTLEAIIVALILIAQVLTPS
jgi:hypothetical protein